MCLSTNVRKVFATFGAILILKREGGEPGNFSLSRFFFVVFVSRLRIKL